MVITMENKKFTENSLNSLQRAVEENLATVADFQALEDTLNAFGINSYLSKEFKNHNFDKFEDFINYRNRDKKSIDSDKVARVLGIIRGVIKFIKTKI
jgi:hypothetical protein